MIVWVWVVGLGDAGTVSHSGGGVLLTLTLVLSHQGRGDMVGVVLFHPHLSPLPSRERGFGCVGLLTRVTLPPLWIADQVRNDVTMRGIVFTLTFDSSPIKGEGIWLVLSCCHPTALWILP